MKIGFIGTGNMANAIIKGILAAGVMDGKDISVFDIDQNKSAKCGDAYGVFPAAAMNGLIESSDAIVLAVKPNVFATLLPQIGKELEKKNPLIISIAAGKSIEFIENLLPYKAAVVRVMPNINAKVAGAMCAYCANHQVTDDQKVFVAEIFHAVGHIIALDESYFPLFGVLAGSAPAFAYMFIDSLARAGVKNGMNKQVALQIAAQTVYGSAKMILESDEHPWELIDHVCSPGGTTIEGICQLQECGLEAAVTKAVDAGVAKDKKI